MVISSYILFGEGYNTIFIYASQERLTHRTLLFPPAAMYSLERFQKVVIKTCALETHTSLLNIAVWTN